MHAVALLQQQLHFRLDRALDDLARPAAHQFLQRQANLGHGRGPRIVCLRRLLARTVSPGAPLFATLGSLAIGTVPARELLYC